MIFSKKKREELRKSGENFFKGFYVLPPPLPPPFTVQVRVPLCGVRTESYLHHTPFFSAPSFHDVNDFKNWSVPQLATLNRSPRLAIILLFQTSSKSPIATLLLLFRASGCFRASRSAPSSRPWPATSSYRILGDAGWDSEKGVCGSLPQ